MEPDDLVAVVVDDEFTPTVGPLAAERGLPLMASEVVTGGTPAPLPDVDTERLLVERLGDTGKRLHTGRSRNEQVSLDLRLYLRRRLP